METIQLNLNKQQFFRILQAMDERDRLEIYDRLRKSLFVIRIYSIYDADSTHELRLEHITK